MLLLILGMPHLSRSKILHPVISAIYHINKITVMSASGFKIKFYSKKADQFKDSEIGWILQNYGTDVNELRGSFAEVSDRNGILEGLLRLCILYSNVGSANI
jgi:hypothetical protein